VIAVFAGRAEKWVSKRRRAMEFNCLMDALAKGGGGLCPWFGFDFRDRAASGSTIHGWMFAGETRPKTAARFSFSLFKSGAPIARQRLLKNGKGACIDYSWESGNLVPPPPPHRHTICLLGLSLWPPNFCVFLSAIF